MFLNTHKLLILHIHLQEFLLTLFPRLTLFSANDEEQNKEGSVWENSHEQESPGMFLKMESPAILLPFF